jgi:hypothetical protein
MTQLEYDTYPESPCLCGAGQILKHIASTNYRHDRPRISYSIDCHICASRWKIDYGTLVDKQSELPYIEAKLHDETARQQLATLANEVTCKYISTMKFSSKKAELEYLTANNLTGATYASYLKDRSKGRSMSDLAYAQRNQAWLLDAAANQAERDQLSVLLDLCRQTAAAAEAANKQIIRHGLRRP